MALRTTLQVRHLSLSDAESARIQQQLDGLERRLAHRPEPQAELVLQQEGVDHHVLAALRVQLGPQGAHLVSRQTAPSATRAVRLAVADVERQLERRQANQRGEPSYGVPSRRLPAALRPHPPGEMAAEPSEP